MFIAIEQRIPAKSLILCKMPGEKSTNLFVRGGIRMISLIKVGSQLGSAAPLNKRAESHVGSCRSSSPPWQLTIGQQTVENRGKDNCCCLINRVSSLSRFQPRMLLKLHYHSKPLNWIPKGRITLSKSDSKQCEMICCEEPGYPEQLIRY